MRNVLTQHGVGFFGTAAEYHCEHFDREPVQRADDLSALYGGFLLEFLGSLQAPQCALPDRSAGADNSRRHAAGKFLSKATVPFLWTKMPDVLIM